jgi:stearoyl-CoA desaturase (delta-9 desaturase)
VNPVERAQSRGAVRIYLNPRTIPFWGTHIAAAVGIAILGWSWMWFGLAIASYYARMFFVTGAYHRYFSHRSYKTSRWFQFVLALGATTTGQKGPLWWAHHHRHHHRRSDMDDDLHSVKQGGFWWSHVGWIIAKDFESTDYDKIKDFAKYPELRWLNKYWFVPLLTGAAMCFVLGGWMGLVYVALLSTVLLWHGTFTINSLSHVFGARPYDTTDDSKNNFILALITMGEGWHNNHHYYQVSCAQGFRWYQIDLTYYILRALAVFGIVWDLKRAPDHIKENRPKDTVVALAERIAARAELAARTEHLEVERPAA